MYEAPKAEVVESKSPALVPHARAVDNYLPVFYVGAGKPRAQ